MRLLVLPQIVEERLIIHVHRQDHPVADALGHRRVRLQAGLVWPLHAAEAIGPVRGHGVVLPLRVHRLHVLVAVERGVDAVAVLPVLRKGEIGGARMHGGTARWRRGRRIGGVDSRVGDRAGSARATRTAKGRRSPGTRGAATAALRLGSTRSPASPRGGGSTPARASARGRASTRRRVSTRSALPTRARSAGATGAGRGPWALRGPTCRDSAKRDESCCPDWSLQDSTRKHHVVQSQVQSRVGWVISWL